MISPNIYPAAGETGGIPESQFQTWSNIGAQVTASATYRSVQSALNAYEFPYGVRYTIYLQGSYRNKTNIRSDSDVDVVVQLNSTYRVNIDDLSPAEKRRYDAQRIAADYSFCDFRRDVEKALRAYYGWGSVTSRSKCIEVARDKANNRLGADVVPCLEHRHYTQFTDGGKDDYIEGMAFEPQSVFGTGCIVNYPKLHYAHGAWKNSATETNGWFKPSVRLFKNARNKYNEAWLRDVKAPSYFVACLLYNVPSNLYGGTYRETFSSIVGWLANTLADRQKANALLCQNDQVTIFGNGPDQWSLGEARAFVKAMAALWRDW